jgi:hypothetical protein
MDWGDENQSLARQKAGERRPFSCIPTDGIVLGQFRAVWPSLSQVLHFCGNSFLLLFGKKDRQACLPVEKPIKFELLVNLRTVKELGLDVPPSLLARVVRRDDVPRGCRSVVAQHCYSPSTKQTIDSVCPLAGRRARDAIGGVKPSSRCHGIPVTACAWE